MVKVLPEELGRGHIIQGFVYYAKDFEHYPAGNGEALKGLHNKI